MLSIESIVEREHLFLQKSRLSISRIFFIYLGVYAPLFFFIGFRVYKEKRKKKEEGKIMLQKYAGGGVSLSLARSLGVESHHHDFDFDTNTRDDDSKKRL